MNIIHSTYFALFAIAALGLLLSKIKIKGISFGMSSIILVALVFGHFGIVIPAEFKQIGLILFIYSVGIQVGPGFFDSFNRKSLPLLAVTIVILLSGVIIAFLLCALLGYDTAMTAGLYAGALSSSSGLAAATGTLHNPAVSVAFGIVYPIGILAVIIFLVLAPKLFNIHINEEEERYICEIKRQNPELLVKNYLVQNSNLFGKTIAESNIRAITGANISQVKHNQDVMAPKADMPLEQGDVVRVSGTPEVHDKVKLLIGDETAQTIAPHKNYDVRQILITNKAVVNKTFEQLQLNEHYEAIATHLRRSGIDIIPRADVKLRFGDKITVTCPTSNIKEVVSLLGGNKSQSKELDFFPIAVGILLGLLLGNIVFPVVGFKISLGITGGVLISSMILSRLGKTGRILWNISGSKNQFMRKLGLIFFLSAIGTDAGKGLLATIQTQGLGILFSGLIIAVVPMIIGFLVGKYVLKLNLVTLLGVLTGSMTSTPGLDAVETLTKSNAARLAYAATYPFALVLIIIICQIIVLF
jgi:putative transport protein